MAWIMLVTTTAPAQIPFYRSTRQRMMPQPVPATAPSDSVTAMPPGTVRGLDALINPDEYVIGPGDQFVLVVKSSGAQYDLIVLPGGNVLLPNAGMVAAAGLTITQFRTELKRVAQQFYRGGEFYCELVIPRTFVVYVLGDVRTPGPVDIAAPFRLDMIITSAGGVVGRGSQREIQVRNPDGTMKVYDLMRLQRLGELAQNPMLHEGQSIFVPSRGAAADVTGEVWRGGTYEIVAGETVRDLINLAGGFTTNADSTGLVLERITDKNQVSIVKLGGEGLNMRLQDRDVVVVPDRRSFPGIDYVRVQGGGGRDGRIYLQEGETLASFRPRFIRLRNDFDLANSSIERRGDDGTVEFIKVDLKRLVEGDTTRTVALKSGDVINIPPLQDVVFVAGEVVNPGGQDFQRGLPAGRYIAMAGGPTEVGSIDKLEIYDDHGNRRDGNRDDVVYRGETILVKRRTGVILGNLFLGFVSLTSLFLSVWAVVDQTNN
ncbi:MAG TPA: SLBB domain-containing protein [Candidatus Krumholzibacteria bacterium]